MIRAELEYIKEETHNGNKWFVFQSTAATSNELNLALHAVFGMGIHNIQEIGAAAERFVWHKIRSLLPLDYDYNRKLLIVDTGSYPIILARIDDCVDDGSDTSQFGQDVYNAWKKPFDGLNIPTIVVNANIPFTGLKYIN